MAIGKQKLADLAEVAFTEIEQEASDNAVVGTGLLVVEVREKDAEVTTFYTFSTDKRRWIQAAMLREALEFVGTPMPGEVGD